MRQKWEPAIIANPEHLNELFRRGVCISPSPHSSCHEVSKINGADHENNNSSSSSSSSVVGSYTHHKRKNQHLHQNYFDEMFRFEMADWTQPRLNSRKSLVQAHSQRLERFLHCNRTWDEKEMSLLFPSTPITQRQLRLKEGILSPAPFPIFLAMILVIFVVLLFFKLKSSRTAEVQSKNNVIEI